MNAKSFFYVIITVFISRANFGYCQDFKSTFEMCAKEYSITNANEISDHFKKNGELPDESNRNAKCLFFCVPLKFGLVDDKGDMDFAKAKELFIKFHPDYPKIDEVDKLLERCTKKLDETADPCERVYESKKCLMKEYLNSKSGQ